MRDSMPTRELSLLGWLQMCGLSLIQFKVGSTCEMNILISIEMKRHRGDVHK